MTKERIKSIAIIALSVVAVIGWIIAFYDFDPYDWEDLGKLTYQEVVDRHGPFYAEEDKSSGGYICAINRSDDYPYCFYEDKTFTYVYFNSKNIVSNIRTSAKPLDQVMEVENQMN